MKNFVLENKITILLFSLFKKIHFEPAYRNHADAVLGSDSAIAPWYRRIFRLRRGAFYINKGQKLRYRFAGFVCGYWWITRFPAKFSRREPAGTEPKKLNSYQNLAK